MSPLVPLGLSFGVALTMGDSAKRVVFEAVKVSKLEEVSYEMQRTGKILNEASWARLLARPARATCAHSHHQAMLG